MNSSYKSGRKYSTDNREEYEQRRDLKWFIIVMQDEDNEPSEELDLYATDRSAAHELAKRVIASDYEPGLTIGEVMLA